MSCLNCEKSSFVINGKCFGCVARYVLRTYTSENQAAALEGMAKKYDLDYQTLRDEAARQLRANRVA